jgi:hypothetical protein
MDKEEPLPSMSPPTSASPSEGPPEPPAMHEAPPTPTPGQMPMSDYIRSYPTPPTRPEGPPEHKTID